MLIGVANKLTNDDDAISSESLIFRTKGNNFGLFTWREWTQEDDMNYECINANSIFSQKQAISLTHLF